MSIKFKDYQEGKLSIADITSALRSGLKTNDYFLLSKEEIVYRCLLQFDFHDLENDAESIKKHAAIVLACERRFLTVEKPISLFLLIYLDIKILPTILKLDLETIAKEHLRTLDDLSDFYLSHPFIKEYSEATIKPRNHQEKTQLESYRRTQKKRAEVLEYLTKGGLEKRAIAKSNPFNRLEIGGGHEKTEQMFAMHTDFPYLELVLHQKDISFGLDLERLDYRKINSFFHKIHMMAGVDLADGYIMDIEKPVEIKVPAEGLLNGLLTDLEFVPHVNNRKPIFEELRSLYLTKSFYGFYALALPQVEGIFAEMLQMLKEKQPKGALPEKVNLVRPYYSSSKYTFDYFEFFLPEWRNQFAHTGLVKNVETRCKYLLLDLKYLLDTCINLDSPIAKISKKVKEGIDGFQRIDDLADFLTTLMSIGKKSSLEHIQGKINDFIYGELLTRLKIDETWNALTNDFKKNLPETEKQLKLCLAIAQEDQFDLFSLSPGEVDRRIKSIGTAYEAFELALCDPLRSLMDVLHINEILPTCFPDIEPHILKAIGEFKAAYKQQLIILSIIDHKLKLDLSNAYLLTTPPSLIFKM